jgi:phosphoribosyl 1,2-cyclic phosphate phosphodiesterase
MSALLSITFLGTGTSTGVPMIGCTCAVCTSTHTYNKRLRTSALLQWDGYNVVIDTTPDFRYQLLRLGIKKIDAVLYTHPHKDHLSGLDEVRAISHFTKLPMQVFANDITEKAIRHDFHYAFAEKKYPGVPDIVINKIENKPFTLFGKTITPILVWHAQMPVFGFKIDDLVYITDANKIEPIEQEKLKNAKILVLNALRHENHVSHFTLDQAISLSQQSQAKNTYFTHISHQMGLHQQVQERLPNNIFLAYDGLQLSLH